MKKLFFAYFFVFILLNACKKKDPDPALNSFSGITQTYQGKEIPLFEFSNSKLSAFNALLWDGTQMVIKRSNYQLTYKGLNLHSAIIDSQIQPVFTFNAKNQIVSASSSKGHFTYTYDGQDRLSSIITPGYTYVYTYSQNGDLFQAIASYSTGQTIATIESGIGLNPLKGLPLAYLEGDVPIWTMFSLNNHIIGAINYTYIDNRLGGFSLKYSFTYNSDQYNRPTIVKHYDPVGDLISTYTFRY